MKQKYGAKIFSMIKIFPQGLCALFSYFKNESIAIAASLKAKVKMFSGSIHERKWLIFGKIIKETCGIGVDSSPSSPKLSNT